MILFQRKLLWVGLLITLLNTSLVLQWSARQGRLALPVYFDDNHSMVDGARRLEIWYQQGAASVFKDYLSHPSHAPGHSAIAMASFALFGLHAWAPYLTNAIFFGLILYALHLALQGIAPWIQSACMLLLAASPIAGLSILEFRSEIDVAELGALAVLLFITWSRKEGNPLLVSASALCFALCFIIKPAVFPYTAGLMGLCGLFHLRRVVLAGDLRITPRQYLLSIGWFILLGILPPLPHYVLDWHHITGYIGAVAFSPSSIWLRHDDLLTGLLFHVTGYPGRIMMGASLKPHLVIILLSLVVRFLRSGSWPVGVPLLSLLFFTSGAYLGLAVNPMNQNYFGMTFHWLLLITTLAALSGLITAIFSQYLPAAGMALCAFAVVVFFTFKFPLSIDFFREKAGSDSETFVWLQRSPELVLGSVRKEYKSSGATKVWITAYTMINARTLEWYSLLNREPFVFKDFFENDWQAVRQNLDWADIVVVPEKGTPSIETILPNASMAGRMVEQLDRDPRFKLLERLGSPHGGPGFRIYTKIH